MKKIISLVLCLIICVSLVVPAAAYTPPAMDGVFEKDTCVATSMDQYNNNVSVGMQNPLISFNNYGRTYYSSSYSVLGADDSITISNTGLDCDELATIIGLLKRDSESHYKWASESYKASLYAVVLSDGVTEIADFAFRGACITGIIVPKTVTKVGQYALTYYGQTPVEVPDIGWFRSTIFFLGDVPEEWGEKAVADNTLIGYIEGKDGWTSPTWTDPSGVLHSNMQSGTKEAYEENRQIFEADTGIELPSA